MTDTETGSEAAIAWEDPFNEFAAWFEEAKHAEKAYPDAMNLATVDEQGRPSSRIVLLKDFDTKGFVFYTNYESRKGTQIAGNPYAALCFHWKTLERVVRIEGKLEKVSAEESDAYFATRARASQIGAWASKQSQPMAGRFELEKRVAEFTAKFGISKVPRPDHWGGYLLRPERIELWEEGTFRLHRRRIFTPIGAGWQVEKQFP